MNLTLTPSKLRALLIGSLVLIIAATAGLFAFGYQQLNSVAEATKQSNADANKSSQELMTLTTLKTALDKQQSNVKRAAQIVSATKNYSYQDQVVKDLNTYANESGLAITNIDFSANNSDAKSASSSSSSKSSAAATAPNGTKRITATISLHNPVSYDAVYRFLYRVEKNLFQLQTSNIGLSIADGGLAVSELTIVAYVR